MCVFHTIGSKEINYGKNCESEQLRRILKFSDGRCARNENRKFGALIRKSGTFVFYFKVGVF